MLYSTPLEKLPGAVPPGIEYFERPTLPYVQPPQETEIIPHHDLPEKITNKLPSNSIEELIKLIDSKIIDILKKAHHGRIPAIKRNGGLSVIDHWDDMHHIVHQGALKISISEVRKMFPFPEVDFLLDNLDNDCYLFMHSIVNLIPLDWTTHHNRIHNHHSPVETVDTVYGKLSLKEVLFAFVIFNIEDRYKDIEEYFNRWNGRRLKGTAANAYNDLININKAAGILRQTRPHLYDVWSWYVKGPLNQREM